ncbi:Fe-S cluster assembly protein SufD [Nitrosomonas halophila]|uniref:Fe-S cluster assembly protein SufD n=1 Tax=Nitrosomonas halophila TaxID=44576 RepID=A0A1H3FLL2_9PROT|nr:Fe-S cluster assembly protein SufD [Nitrosomonas halophila]SDX91024.1 Fe-S cluster assembly protein SufD [Nitrosomonas halophila]
MSSVIKDDYLTQLIASWKAEAAASAMPAMSWLDQLRTSAAGRIEALRLPTTRDEEWRFTDITPLKSALFPRASVASSLTGSDIARYTLDDVPNRVVFVDGQFSAELSSIEHDSGVIAGNLSSLAREHTATVAHHLGRLADFQDDIFVALNTAFLHDGVGIIIPADVSAAAPIHVLFITSQPEQTTYPRCLVIAEPGARATLVEEYVALRDAAYLTNSVMEMHLARSAQVQHMRVQRESQQAFHIANNTTVIAPDACYRAVSLTLGAQISRYSQNIVLAGEHAECAIDGLTLIAGKQLADTHTFIDHAKPHGRSQQLHKCIADDSARGVFSGKIMVRPHAQLTDSRQMSRNLLLSDKARVDTKPQLEIFADDVKCAHGATIGQLDKEALFYLRSRGLSDAAARNLLTYAFGGEVINRIPVASLKQQLEKLVLVSTQVN